MVFGVFDDGVYDDFKNYCDFGFVKEFEFLDFEKLNYKYVND